MPISDPEFENSAGRLIALLESIPAGQKMTDTLPELMGLDTSAGVHERQQTSFVYLMEMHKVYLEFRQDMLDADVSEQQRNAMLSGLASLEDSLYSSSVKSAFRTPTDAEISLLKICATFISEEAPISESDIEAIRSSVSDLRKLIESGDISPTLRKALLEFIRLTEDAISRFNIHGARGLKRAYKAMLADAAELYGMTAQEENSADLKGSTAWDLIIQHLRTVDDVASKLLKYKPLLESAATLLLGNSPPEA